MGARPLARLIDNQLKSPLSRRVLFGDLVNGGLVTVGVENDQLTFQVTEIAKPLSKEEKKALKASLKAAQEINDLETENQENEA
jgi:hypothetical protein